MQEDGVVLVLEHLSENSVFIRKIVTLPPLSEPDVNRKDSSKY